MKLVHKKKVLAGNVVLYKNIFSRGWGLRFSMPIKDKALVFVSPDESIFNSSIDMFFVFFPIDVLWLDSKCEVVDVKQNVRPFSLPIKPKSPAKFVVELPAGSVKEVKIGDKVIF